MAALKPQDYGRLAIVSAECAECGARRGQPCRSMAFFRDGGLVFRYYGLSNTHRKRKDAAYMWRIRNRDKYLKLRQQVLDGYPAAAWKAAPEDLIPLLRRRIGDIPE